MLNQHETEEFSGPIQITVRRADDFDKKEYIMVYQDYRFLVKFSSLQNRVTIFIHIYNKPTNSIICKTKLVLHQAFFQNTSYHDLEFSPQKITNHIICNLANVCSQFISLALSITSIDSPTSTSPPFLSFKSQLEQILPKSFKDSVHTNTHFKSALEYPKIDTFPPCKFQQSPQNSRPKIPSVNHSTNVLSHFQRIKSPAQDWPLDDQLIESSTDVGLKNQGSTCYLNSIIQILYHIPIFRRFIFSINSLDSKLSDDKNALLQLQLLFAQLQTSDIPVDTENLTRSFGWAAEQVYKQQDASEFFNELLDYINKKVSKKPLINEINSLFQIVTRTTYRGTDVDFEEHSDDSFYLLQLVVSEISIIQDSLAQLTREQLLTGDDQYDSQKYSKQDAVLTTHFMKAPPILFFHLKRFEFDPSTNQNIKINSIFMFSEELDLRPYFDQHGDIPKCNYELFSVLVHNGHANSGHYLVYIKNKDNKWYCYNDSNVTQVSKEEAIDNNFGNLQSFEESNSSAYILVYIKIDEKNNLFNVDVNKVNHNLIEKQRMYDVENDKLRVFIVNEDTLKRIAFEGHVSFCTSRQNMQIVNSWLSYSSQLFYDSVQVQLQLNSGDFSLYKFNDAQLIEKIQKEENDLINCVFENDICLFCTNLDHYNSDDIIIVIFIYDPKYNHPLRYLCQFPAKSTDLVVCSIRQKLMSLYDILLSNPIVSYKHGQMIKRVDNQDQFNLIPSSIFIVESSTPFDLPFIFQNDNEMYSTECTHYFDCCRENLLSFTQYFNLINDMMMINVRAKDNIGDPFSVRVPNSLPYFRFIAFLKIILHIDNSSFLYIYKSCSVTQISHEFADFEVFKVFRGTSEIIVIDLQNQIDNLIFLNIIVSLDAIHTDENKHQYHCTDKSLTLGEFLLELRDLVPEFKVFPNLRVLEMKNGLISSMYSLNQSIMTLENPIRVEPSSDPSCDLIPVLYQSFDSDEKLNFLLEKVKNEPFEVTKRRILDLLKIDHSDQLRFCLKSPNENTTLANNVILADMDTRDYIIKISQLLHQNENDVSLKIRS